MENDKFKNFKEELVKLTEKYGIRNGVFAGDSDNSFVGMIGMKEIKNIDEFALCVLSSARLYQSAREKMLNYFENVSRARLT